MLRYDKKLQDWAARRAEICAHFEKSQCYAETGAAFGLTRERIRQIVRREKGAVGRPPRKR
jgi:DNA-directed RNA polymerase sigma subunit (sigma70/sigma32)